MSNIGTIHFLLHSIECIREMGTTDINYTKISEAAQEHLVKDGYHSSNKVHTILQI